MAQNTYQCQSEGLSNLDKLRVYTKYDTQDKNKAMMVHYYGASNLCTYELPSQLQMASELH